MTAWCACLPLAFAFWMVGWLEPERSILSLVLGANIVSRPCRLHEQYEAMIANRNILQSRLPLARIPGALLAQLVPFKPCSELMRWRSSWLRRADYPRRVYTEDFQACLKGFMLQGVRFCRSILPFRFTPRGRIHFPIGISLWQSNGKVEKFL